MPLIAVYPGSFDPLTFGHIDIIKRAANLVDELYVAILRNSAKQPFLPEEIRLAHLNALAAECKNIKVETWAGLLVDYVREKDAVIIKGLRNTGDFEYEMIMAAANKHLYAKAETLFLPAGGEMAHISSSLIREIAVRGGSLTGMTPDYVAEDIRLFVHNQGG